jgi:hypothetical protein
MKTDSQFRSDVIEELEWEPSIDASHIGVAASRSAPATLSAWEEETRVLMDVHSWLMFLFAATFVVALLAMAQFCN